MGDGTCVLPSLPLGSPPFSPSPFFFLPSSPRALRSTSAAPAERKSSIATRYGLPRGRLLLLLLLLLLPSLLSCSPSLSTSSWPPSSS